jgi:acyl transferase domain-containing protein/NADPH:quinone reductase-like Zn-dependent oxidoreductase/acyl carrier protein/short-subunit dehydrogenase
MSVEIVGRACVAPGADSAEQLFDVLRQRRCTVSQVPDDRWDKNRYWHPTIGVRGKTYSFAAGIVDDAFSFDPTLFGLSMREAQMFDPQQRMILQVTWRALEDASIDHADLRDQRVGVYVGASSLDHGNLAAEDPSSAGPHFMTGNTLSIVSNRISHVFALSGPSMTIDTACSSSLVALDLAVQALNAGEIDTAIVGGVNALTHPLPFVGFAQARMLSPDGLCRAYDNDGIGYVRAEGAAVVILRRSDVAHRLGDRSHASILASGVNSAGRTNGISLPSAEAQAALLRSVYENAGIDPNRLAFIEGHGTGTKVGDPAEIWSIGTVIGAGRRAPIPIGSIKTNIGHAEPASGLMGLLKATMALEHNYLPASLHFDTPNESVDFGALNVHVASEPIELLHGKQARLAGVNSFGFGGTNAHVVISDPPAGRERDKPEAAGLAFMASAHTQSALGELLSGYRKALKDANPDERRSIIAAAGANRHALRHRFVVAGKHLADVERAIELRASGRKPVGAVEAEAAQDQGKIAFVFSGNGSQWAGMAVGAYTSNSAFRDRFNVIHALFQVRSQISLVELLTDPDLEARLKDTRIAQPLLFAIQAALADVLALQGIRPHAVFGHSVGEVAAAYAAGAVSLVDAVSIVAKRSLHQHRLAGQGRMAAVQLSPDDAIALCRRLGLDQIVVAAVNAANSVTLSGPTDELLDLRDRFKDERVVGQLLDIDYPFHHPLIELAKNDFLEDMAHIALRPTQIPFISTVTGQELSGDSLDASYWWSNVREPVQFAPATKAAIDLGCRLFVEIGPRPILQSYLKDTIKHEAVAATAIASLRRDDAAADPVGQVYASILANGGAFDRRKAFGSRDTRVQLPPVPFEPVDIRHEFTSETIDLYGRQHKVHTLAGWRVDPSSGSWTNHIDAALYPDLAEHVVDGKPILPGSAYLDMAASVARAFYDSDAIEVSNLEILRPLDLGEHALDVSTTISPSTGDVEIRSRERLSHDNWTLHAVARCRALATPAPAPRAADRSGITITAEAAYETARQFGLDYGPRFQLLSSARLHGRDRIGVTLRPPLPSSRPQLVHSLNPISVDAAFHGLVGFFDQLSGTAGGAPYIPVRLGRCRIFQAGATIAAADIRLRRVSATSVKVDIDFLSEAGAMIASFEDCRFRRTYLRQQKLLRDSSLHEETVPSLVGPLRAATADAATAPDLFAEIADEVPSSAMQMLGAAVIRASYDAVALAAGEARRLDLDSPAVPAELRPFLATALGLLEGADLATRASGQGWELIDDPDLPPVDAILGAVLGEAPRRVAEASAINAIHGEVLRRLGPSGADDAREGPSAPIGDATMEALRAQSETAQRCAALIGDALHTLIASPAGGNIRRIVEVGSISRSATGTFAGIARQAGARFVVIEARAAVRAELTLSFDQDAPVSIVDPGELGPLRHDDLLISASTDAYALLSDLLRQQAARQHHELPALAVCVPAPGSIDDFLFSLPVPGADVAKVTRTRKGRPATAKEWAALLRGVGTRNASCVQRDLSDGPVLLVSAPGRDHAGTTAAADMERPIVVIDTDGRKPDFGQALTVIPISPRWNASLAAALDRADGAAEIIYVPAAPDGDCVDGIARSVMHLARIAQTLAAVSVSASPARMAVLLNADSSSQVGDSALAAYLRTLRNEFTDVEIHAIARTGVDADLAAGVEEAATLMRAGTANREWTIDGRTGGVSETRIVPGPAAAADLCATDYTAATLRQVAPSSIASLGWETCAIPVVEPGQVLVKVEASALNFRDVMWAMGLLPEEALEDGFAGPTIGMECAGTIVAVGPGVAALSPGDRVMAVAPSAFSTHVAVDQSAVTVVPENLDTSDAATIPVAFLTAHYALVELGQLRPGETVLIHGGAGGVGLAALQIAKLRGARVIATAGSVEKRRLLQMLGADLVFNSRSLDFVDDIRAATGGEGVDIVLNSLFAEAMEQSLSLLKPFGRFLELGKRDFYADTKLGLRPFRRNVSYFGIDADQLLSGRPDLCRRLLGELARLFEAGDLRPLPCRLFRYDEIGAAFRLMQGSGHIGKILVSPPVAGRDAVRRAAATLAPIDPDGVHLVIGGVGGFGLAAANWLVERGAKRIALCSRRGIASAEAETAIEQWRRRGVVATVHPCDATVEAEVADLLAALRAQAPIHGVVHAAMVLDDRLVANLDGDSLRSVILPKARAADILDRLTRDDPIDTFLMFSSATTFVGNPGQASYVAANGYLEGLARRRRLSGRPALAVAFGAIADTGYLSRNDAVNETLSKRIGRTAMTAAQALAHVRSYMEIDPGTVDAAVVAIADIDMHAASQLTSVAGPLFEVVRRSTHSQPTALEGEGLDLAALVAGKSREDGEIEILRLVTAEIASILRVPPGELTATKVVRDVGLDSLMAMELATTFRQKTGFDIPLASATQGATIGDVAQRLYAKVTQRSGQEGAAAPATGSVDLGLLDRLASTHRSPLKSVGQG